MTQNQDRLLLIRLAGKYGVTHQNWSVAFRTAYRATRSQPGSLLPNSSRLRWLRLWVLEAFSAVISALTAAWMIAQVQPTNSEIVVRSVIFAFLVVLLVTTASRLIYPVALSLPVGTRRIVLLEPGVALMSASLRKPARGAHRAQVRITNLMAVQRGNRSARPMIDNLLAGADSGNVVVIGTAQTLELAEKYYIAELGFRRESGKRVVRMPSETL